MKILYAASDQTVPGTNGGSVHVAAVAEGLAALGHEVHVLVTPGGAISPGPVHWIAMPPPLGRKELRWANARAVQTIARRLQPHVIIERYYNFGGEGIGAAAEIGAVAVLEVNAPVIDHEGSTKRLLDRALIVEPMRRWRERICAQSDLIVTPSAGILPSGTPPAKILELEWGADTDRFRPGVTGAVPFDRPADTVVVFAGAFRTWHGAIHLATALGELRARGRKDIGAVFIGDGPELLRVREAAAGLDGVVFTGALPHAQIPACLAACDIGVAPFDAGAHPPLSLGFYWSPLKIFEYMATGLPVVAPAFDRIPALVEHNREGLLYDSAIPTGLPHALAALTDPVLRDRLGRNARDRAVREYSWSAHCRALDAAIGKVVGLRAQDSGLRAQGSGLRAQNSESEGE
jgi:glycosyltransferase involved in cell wall biosynthesis